MQANLELFLAENYMAFVILIGLLAIMYAYRNVHVPAGKNFAVIAAVLFIMCIAHSAERWALQSPDRLNLRLLSSIIHYVLQPLVIYLELIIINPLSDKSRNLKLWLLSLPLIVNTFLYITAPLTHELVFWYDDSYTFHRGILGYSVYLVTLFYMCLLIYWSIIYFKAHDRKKGALLFFMIGSAVVTAVLEARDIASGYIDEAFAFGALMYYVYLVTLYEAEVQANLARKELELSQSKLTLLRQQIRPHFVFNSLYIIKSLIRTNPAKAITALEDFSDYLRANVNAIESDKLISFEQELSLVNSYVSLALADESKNISVEYDIKEENFRLPPFTVEPMVENAIRHGLRNGGVVTLSTRREGNEIVIVVSDNGLGIEESLKDKGKKREGTGIENVRIRLAEQCNGTLEISSSSEGTDITIRIPQEEGKPA